MINAGTSLDMIPPDQLKTEVLTDLPELKATPGGLKKVFPARCLQLAQSIIYLNLEVNKLARLNRYAPSGPEAVPGDV